MVRKLIIFLGFLIIFCEIKHSYARLGFSCFGRVVLGFRRLYFTRVWGFSCFARVVLGFCRLYFTRVWGFSCFARVVFGFCRLYFTRVWGFSCFMRVVLGSRSLSSVRIPPSTNEKETPFRCLFPFRADGGIRTLVTRRSNAFRVRPVMTASIRLLVSEPGTLAGARHRELRLNYFTKLAVCLAIANSSFVGTTITVTLSPSFEMIASSP